MLEKKNIILQNKLYIIFNVISSCLILKRKNQWK